MTPGQWAPAEMEEAAMTVRATARSLATRVLDRMMPVTSESQTFTRRERVIPWPRMAVQLERLATRRTGPPLRSTELAILGTGWKLTLDLTRNPRAEAPVAKVDPDLGRAMIDMLLRRQEQGFPMPVTVGKGMAMLGSREEALELAEMLRISEREDLKDRQAEEMAAALARWEVTATARLGMSWEEWAAAEDEAKAELRETRNRHKVEMESLNRMLETALPTSQLPPPS